MNKSVIFISSHLYSLESFILKIWTSSLEKCPFTHVPIIIVINVCQFQNDGFIIILIMHYHHMQFILGCHVKKGKE